MTKEELIEKLKGLADHSDPESAHAWADDLLIEYIGDEDVKAAYDEIIKWYA